MTDDTYQGWTNWDTWDANLWLTNDELVYQTAMEQQHPSQLREIFEEAFASDRFDNAYIDGINPDKVNWQEIYDRLHEGEEDFDESDEETDDEDSQ